MEYRSATTSDAKSLAEMNWQLIRDEHHRNSMSIAELEVRMSAWLQAEYEAMLVEMDGQPIGYALFRRESEYVYLRQLFVAREHRRKGIGRALMNWLRLHSWSEARRIRLDVLIGNEIGIAFWRSVGFRDYCLTMELNFGDGESPTAP